MWKALLQIKKSKTFVTPKITTRPSADFHACAHIRMLHLFMEPGSAQAAVKM
jgi:hypothetical protein